VLVIYVRSALVTVTVYVAIRDEIACVMRNLIATIGVDVRWFLLLFNVPSLIYFLYCIFDL